MTLEEAITHAREIAEHGGECAEDHEQLAEWLEELCKLRAITATLGKNTLTAEQVKQIYGVIEKHWHDLPTEYDMPEATALPEYSYDWQAIADELNTELVGEPPQTVYIVESYDSLIEGGYVEPTCYRTKQAAIRLAESLTYDDGGDVRYWACWKELKVVDE